MRCVLDLLRSYDTAHLKRRDAGATQQGNMELGTPLMVGKGALTREGTGAIRSGGQTVPKCACPGAHQALFPLKTSSGFFRKTVVSGGTDSVSHTFPPITERAPITVVPPRIVAFA